MSKPSQERRRYKSQTNSCSELKPLIEEFANHVERGADIEAGNSFRGLLTALGELLNSFKEIIKDGLCWFPRLMRWQTSKGEVSPVFEDNRNEGYYYRLKSYGYPYKAGIPKGTDTAGNQAGKPYWHNRTVSAECGGCRKAGAAYGCRDESKS